MHDRICRMAKTRTHRTSQRASARKKTAAICKKTTAVHHYKADPAEAYLREYNQKAVVIRLMTSPDVVATDVSMPAMVRGSLAWISPWAVGILGDMGRVTLVPRHAIGTIEPGGELTEEKKLGFIE